MLTELIQLEPTLTSLAAVATALGVFYSLWKRYLKGREAKAVRSKLLETRLRGTENKIKEVLETEKELIDHMNVENIRYTEISTTLKIHTESLRDLDRDFQELIKIIIEKGG